MIRDIQEDDVDLYVVDELQKRILIENYHPIFQLEVSQFTQTEIPPEDPQEENKIAILMDKIINANVEQTITINVKDFNTTKYRKTNDGYEEILNIVRGYYKDGDKKFYSDYNYENSINIDNHTLYIDNDTQERYITINNEFKKVNNLIPGLLENNEFKPFFTNYNNYPEIETTIIDPIITTEETLISEYLDINSTYNNTDLFIVYDNTIQLTIKDINQRVFHTAEFPHLAADSIEYKCVFTTPGLYTLDVKLINETRTIEESSFIVKVIKENEFNEIIEINNIEPESDEQSLYLPNKIGNRIINPRINQPTNLKCSLNSLVLNNNYIKDLLNSNRSNLVFTSPTKKEYQVYKYEAHNIYDNDGNVKDTWFFINTNFIDEYIELHILPTYINAMDNIILLSDNDFINSPIIEQSSQINKINILDDITDIDSEEYKINIINDDRIIIANTPICSEPQWFEIDYILNENYKISFDCYSSYYYRSIFYINDLQIYRENNSVYLKYNDTIDIIPYDLLCKGEHNIEVSIEDNQIALGIDEYIISTDILKEIDAPTRIGFQQTKLNEPITEVLAINDIDSYTYIKNLFYESIIHDQIIDVTKEKLSQKDNQRKYKFPLNGVKNLSKLEIDIVRTGINSNIIGVIDKTSLKYIESQGYDSYDETTLLDYCVHQNKKNIHKPIQYNNDDIYPGIFNHNDTYQTKNLNIEEINNIKTLQDKEYEYNISKNNVNIIQTLKYFNDDLYSETYTQTNSDLSDSLSLISGQYYEQHWNDKENMYAYYEVTFND